MRISLTGFLTPSQLLLAPVILSLLVWSLPGDSLHPHGFSERAEVSFGRALVLLGSYSIAGGIILAALTIHNLVRNGNYYRLFGLDNPIAMNLYLILTYLGAPGQVYLSVLSSIFNGRVEKQGPATRTAEAMTPTFRRSSKADKSGITDPAIYRYSVDYIAPNFNTDLSFRRPTQSMADGVFSPTYSTCADGIHVWNLYALGWRLCRGSCVAFSRTTHRCRRGSGDEFNCRHLYGKV